MSESSTPTEPESESSGAQPQQRRTPLIAAVVLAGLLVVGVVVVSRFAPTEEELADPGVEVQAGPLPLVPIDAPDATSESCSGLLAALPKELPSGDRMLPTLPIADPAPPGTYAWGVRGDAVVLRCGLGKPPELTPTSSLQQISGTQWLPVAGEESTTWFAVDRPVYLALTVPGTAGTGPLQTVSETVDGVLQAQPVRP